MSYTVTITRIEDNGDPVPLLELNFKKEDLGESIRCLGEYLISYSLDDSAGGSSPEQAIATLARVAMEMAPEKVGFLN
jgi:hypothetical protein